MPKIVINTCYGGFSLSPKAVARIAEIKGRQCFFFVNRDEKGGLDLDVFKRVTPEEASKELFWLAYDTETPPTHEWNGMSEDERIAANEEDAKHHLDRSPDDRADPILVRVVEELGEAAGGSHANLKIVEIPEGVEWEIDEYDGMEQVAESHRTWS